MSVDIDTLLRYDAPDLGPARFVLGGRFGVEPLDDSVRRVDHFVERGGQLVETAHSYARGASKEALGAVLKTQAPGTIGIITKVGHDFRGGDIALDPLTVRQHLSESLSALGVETVDVMMYHCDDPTRSVDELADTLIGLVDAGHTRRVGASNWAPDRLEGLAARLKHRGHQLVGSYHFSLADPDPALLRDTRFADPATLDVLRRDQLPLISWSSQAQGFFARTEARPAERGPDPFDTAPNRARRDRCAELAGELGTRPETVALAWTLQQPGVWPSIGPNTVEQIDRSFDALEVSLTDDQVRWLRDGG